MAATDWQVHSVRGFLWMEAKKHSFKIESTKTEAGDRIHQIKQQTRRAVRGHLQGWRLSFGHDVRLLIGGSAQGEHSDIW